MHSGFRVFRQRLRSFPIIAIAVVLLALSYDPAYAQSGAQYRQWLEWCASIGGTPTGGASNPRCIPGAGNQGPTEDQLRFARAKEKHDQALQLWSSQDWDRIIPLIEEAIAIWADPAFVNNLRRAREARDAKIKRGHFLRHFKAGDAAFDVRQWAEAIRHYEAALAIEPTDSASMHNLRLARERLADQSSQENKAAAATVAINNSVQRLQASIAEPVSVNKYYQLGANSVDSLDNISKILDEKAFALLEQKDGVEAFLQILATSWSIALPHNVETAQRRAAVEFTKSQLRSLLLQAVASSTALMVRDLKKTEPFWWNPFGIEQRAIIAMTERQIADAKNRAIGDIQSESAFYEFNLPSGSALNFRSSPALAELRQINRTMNWDK